MGCSSSLVDDRTIINKTKAMNTLPEELKKKYELYMISKTKLSGLQENINIKFRDDYSELITEMTEASISRFFKLYDSTLSANNISREELVNFLNENKEMKKFLLDTDFKSFNIHNIVLELINGISNPEISNDNKIFLKKLLEENKKYFPNEQKGIHGLFESEQKNWISIFTALKFNSQYNDLRMLSFKINSTISNLELIKSFSEIIQCNFYLVTCVLKISFNSENPNENKLFLENFCVVLDAIKQHGNLRVLFISFEENEKNFTFPQRLFDIIFDILRKNILIGLIITGITISSENGKKLSEVIGNCPSLKLCLLNTQESMSDYYDDFLINLSKNKTLEALFISGGGLSLEQIKKIIQRMESLKVFDYREKLK